MLFFIILINNFLSIDKLVTCLSSTFFSHQNLFHLDVSTNVLSNLPTTSRKQWEIYHLETTKTAWYSKKQTVMSLHLWTQQRVLVAQKHRTKCGTKTRLNQRTLLRSHTGSKRSCRHLSQGCDLQHVHRVFCLSVCVVGEDVGVNHHSPNRAQSDSKSLSCLSVQMSFITLRV